VASPCKILFVEDDSAFRQRIIRKYLTGCHVTEAGDVPAFYRTQNILKFHIILMDYELPGGNGEELVKQVRSHNFDGAVVGISSSAYYNRLLLQAGADTAIEKQQSYRLPQTIRHALSVAALRTGNQLCNYNG